MDKHAIIIPFLSLGYSTFPHIFPLQSYMILLKSYSFIFEEGVSSAEKECLVNRMTAGRFPWNADTLPHIHPATSCSQFPFPKLCGKHEFSTAASVAGFSSWHTTLWSLWQKLTNPYYKSQRDKDGLFLGVCRFFDWSVRRRWLISNVSAQREREF